MRIASTVLQPSGIPRYQKLRMQRYPAAQLVLESFLILLASRERRGSALVVLAGNVNQLARRGTEGVIGHWC